ILASRETALVNWKAAPSRDCPVQVRLAKAIWYAKESFLLEKSIYSADNRPGSISLDLEKRIYFQKCKTRKDRGGA
ncbi:hypothetical protein, partial [Alkalispirochaeta alkalica]|uniref:hypothetical protein n=1 Tax=Alkalispirochaeta alkalica TaxID=46356 RepID=UPI001C0322D6